MNLAEPPQRMREYVDFNFVPERQAAMHDRLLNWGRACFSRTTSTTAPMFRFYQSQQRVEAVYCAATKQSIDRSDAHKIAVGVYALPDPHRISLHWFYVQRGAVMQGRRALGCSAEALARYVSDGRLMLINRGV